MREGGGYDGQENENREVGRACLWCVIKKALKK